MMNGNPNETTMSDWQSLIPEDARRAQQGTGFTPESRPQGALALLVVDVTLGFMGARGQTVEESQRDIPTGTGDMGWEALPRIRRLIDVFRSADRPVVFTRMDTSLAHLLGNATMRALHFGQNGGEAHFGSFPEEILPAPGDYVLAKTKASSFFQTPLAAYLTMRGIGSVVICGVGTSGCVRATAVDAFSHGYRAFVVHDCCFDRSHFSHATNLFDMNGRYASIVSSADVEDWDILR